MAYVWLSSSTAFTIRSSLSILVCEMKKQLLRMPEGLVKIFYDGKQLKDAKKITPLSNSGLMVALLSMSGKPPALAITQTSGHGAHLR